MSLVLVRVPAEGPFGVRFPSPPLQMLSLTPQSGFPETLTSTNDKAIKLSFVENRGTFLRDYKNFIHYHIISFIHC